MKSADTGAVVNSDGIEKLTGKTITIELKADFLNIFWCATSLSGRSRASMSPRKTSSRPRRPDCRRDTGPVHSREIIARRRAVKAR